MFFYYNFGGFEAFLDKLSDELGYPKNSLSRQFSVKTRRGQYFEPDLVIVNPENGEPLAVVEFKLSEAEKNFTRSRANKVLDAVYALQEAFGKTGIPGYMVARSGDGIKIFSLSRSEGNQLGEIPEFPRYESLLTRAKSDDLLVKSSEINQVKEVRRRTVDRFRVACWSLAALVMFLFFSDVFKWFSLNSQQISLLGAFVALIVIPDVAKLKLLGVEFERHKEEKSKSDQHGEDNKKDEKAD